MPAENTWTHLLQEMTLTLEKRLLDSIGVAVFDPTEFEEQDSAAQLDADGEALGSHIGKVDGIRAKKIAEYYKEQENFWQLGPYVIMLKITDQAFLHEVMGDPVLPDARADDRPCAMFLLLHPEKSLVAKCLEDLYHLSCDFEQGAGRQPWCILDILNAPLKCPKYRSWVLSQLLRLATSLMRRVEVILSEWPHPLFAIGWPELFTSAKVLVVARKLYSDDEINLDAYALGIKLQFPTIEVLLNSGTNAPHQ